MSLNSLAGTQIQMGSTHFARIEQAVLEPRLAEASSFVIASDFLCAIRSNYAGA